MWAVVPLKSVEAAKSRLRPALDANARQRLYVAMARHVLLTLMHTPGVGKVAVVTSSAAIRAFARTAGAEVIDDVGESGTAQACRFALQRLAHEPRILIVSGDLPLLSAEALAPMIALDPASPHVAIAPDRHRTGTNVLLCAPPAVVPMCFGVGSFARHVEAATRCGATVHVVDNERLALDIDQPDDLRLLQRIAQVEEERVPNGIRAVLQTSEEVGVQ
ncbi:MAG TPA: 2-phospho-L-lactate guanylyltransferase [Burkholderiales bacterium]|nr:2-phospho-L-lactate guanylyltransferase [Burkholderiales bacterium]